MGRVPRVVNKKKKQRKEISEGQRSTVVSIIKSKRKIKTKQNGRLRQAQQGFNSLAHQPLHSPQEDYLFDFLMR